MSYPIKQGENLRNTGYKKYQYNKFLKTIPVFQNTQIKNILENSTVNYANNRINVEEDYSNSKSKKFFRNKYLKTANFYVKVIT